MTDRDALRTALAEVQHYSLTVEPDDSAYMELDRDGRYVLIEDVDAVVAALDKSEPAGLREALALLNSLGIAGPNIRHVEQGMWPDGKVSDADTWDGPGWCVCGRLWPCEALALYEAVAALAATPTASPTAGGEPKGRMGGPGHRVAPIKPIRGGS